MKIKNKDLIQSYVMTTARYDYSVDEKRILLRLVETWQNLLEGEKLQGRVEKTLFGDYILEFPLNYFLPDGNKNYVQIKNAFRALNEKKFEYEDDELWEIIRIIEKPQIRKREKIKFELNPKIVDCFLNFTKGRRKFELEISFSFSSVYAMRMYELLSGQKQPLTYTIDNLKLMFKLQDKYPRNPDFVKRIIVPAKKELDKKSPYSFEYAVNKHGKEFYSITFYPVAIPKNRDEQVETASLIRQLGTSTDIGVPETRYLRDMGFSDRQIKNNHDTFAEARRILPDLMYELSLMKGKMREKSNPCGWVINALKGKIRDVKNRL